MSAAPAGIGHNEPPITLNPVEITRDLTTVHDRLLSRRDELLAGVRRFRELHQVIEDDETQGRATDFAKQIAAALKQADDAFEAAKVPYRDAGRAVDRFFKSLREPLNQGLADVKQPMRTYADRLAAEERARREARAAAAKREAEDIQRRLAADDPAVTIETAISAAEAAEKATKAAGARSADLSRVRGDLGGVSSLRTIWDVELLDLSKVPTQYLRFDIEAARRDVRFNGLTEIPGCRVYSRTEIQTR